jgi:iron(III) transport system permease protein
LKFRRDETRIIGIFVIAALVYLVAWPTILLFATAIRVQFADAPQIGEHAGSYTFHYLSMVFDSPYSKFDLWIPLKNTLISAVGACTIAVATGGGLAWLVNRFTFPLRRLLAPALLLPYIVPSWAVGEAWLTTFHNVHFGGSPGVLEGLGIEPPQWLGAGAVPIIIVIGIHLSPFVYLLASGSLRNISAELEEAATVLGASRFTVLRRISGPLLVPAIAAATALVFANVLGDFGTVYILGLPAHYNTLATTLYSNLQSGEMGVVAVIAGLVVVLGAATIWLESRMTRRSTRFVMLRQGPPVSQQPIESRLAAFGATSILFLVVLIGAGLPLFILTSTSVSIIPGRLSFSNFTLRYWISSHLTNYPLFDHGLLRGGELYSSIWNTVRIMGLAAIICGTLGLIVGYVVTRTGSRPLATLLRQLSFLPYLIPGISLAASYIVLFEVRRGPIPPLYGSLTLVLIAMVIVHLPYTSRSAIASFSQMGRSTEEAARVQGASFFRTIKRVVAPQQLRAFATGVTLAFISGMKELNIVIMLTISSAGLLTNLFFMLSGSAYLQQSNGIALVITLLALSGYLLVNKIAHIDLISSLGGTNAANRSN